MVYSVQHLRNNKLNTFGIFLLFWVSGNLDALRSHIVVLHLIVLLLLKSQNDNILVAFEQEHHFHSTYNIKKVEETYMLYEAR